ncbi:MAG: hypothetical protein HZB16_19870 [Armatimonadetes bacterium]|nr:hypothetical protein [Armatimonadota bacterium]
MTVSWWLLAKLVLIGALPGYVADIPEAPRTVVEQSPAQVAVRYSLPAGVPAVFLRCEMKDQRGEVIAQTGTKVTGSGVYLATFPIPALLNTATVQFCVWMGDDWQVSACPIVHARASHVISAARAARLAADARVADVDRLAIERRRTARGLVAVYRGAQPEPPLARRLAADGVGVVDFDGDRLANAQLLRPAVIDMLLLAEPRQMTVEGMESVVDYVRQGGNVVVLGTGAFGRLQYTFDGRALDYDSYLQAVAQSLTRSPLLTFDGADIGVWHRASNDLKPPSQVSREPRGQGGCLRIDIANQTGWDTFEAPAFTQAFATGNSWTCFSAKGDATTPQMSLEWDEKDGSRWIATVALGREWRPFALPPTAFRFWTGPEGRGGAKDYLRPENAVRLAIGLADTHTNQVAHGKHTIWFDDLASAPAPANRPEAAALIGGEAPAAPLEAVSPAYKLFPVTTAKSWRAGAAGLTGTAPLPALPARLSSPHPRPEGTSLDRNKLWRFVPLLETVDAQGLVCGTPAALVLHGADSARGGAVLSVPIDDAAWQAAPSTQAWLAAACERLLEGAFLYEGGAAYYASFGNEAMPVGAVVSNRGRQPAVCTVRATVTGPGVPPWRQDWSVTVAPGQATRLAANWDVPARGGPFQVTVELVSNRGRDKLSHEVRIWRPKANPKFLTARGGDWWRDGRKWYAHGINYMPSSGIGTEEGAYFEQWLSAQSYDPAIVERDLTRIERIGFNQVSVFLYHQSMSARNLIDLLMRCEDHHLLANVSLRPGTPLDFEWPLVREMITQLRLAENDTVMAYDLAWEPNWGTRKDLARWDQEWAAWLGAKYGSPDDAAKAFGVPVPTEDGRVAGPSDQQLSVEGPHKPLVLAYRAFLNDLLRKYYGGARKLVQSVDPNHLVSYRMSGAGDPLWAPPMTTYDFAGLRDGVDFMAPEGYGRLGPWERVRVGDWTAAYARACAPEHPLWWAEFGDTVWSTALNAPNPERIKWQAEFYEMFYRMVYDSGANGTCCWWYPGGYRVGENSDFGIIEPDGAWRPVTQVIAKWAPKMTAARVRKPADVTITLDPTATVRGTAGLYEQCQKQYWEAIDAGKTVALKLP